MSEPHPDLAARWERLLGSLGVAGQDSRAALADLARRYAQPGRHYHTLDHVRFVLDALQELGATPDRAPALFLAAWFHDAVYDTRAADNEEQSARLAADVLASLGVPAPLVAEAGRLILLTKSHRADDGDEAGRQLLDADLAVLGEPPEAYDAYARAIRREYAWVAEADYRAGRGRVLEGFLARPRLFLTPAFFASREAAARQSMGRELADLRR
jgi:predicted metal-dependent HD superfamily phosphohydrolase